MEPQVFLSYNSSDDSLVEELAAELRLKGVQLWMDKRSVVPGQPSQQAIENALNASGVCVVAVGRHGLGPWQEREIRAAINLRVAHPEAHRIIPVLLPGSRGPQDLPLFLREYSWVDLGIGVRPEGIALLMAGIVDGRLDNESKNTMPRSEKGLLALARIDRCATLVSRWATRSQNPNGGLPSDGFGTLSCAWATAGLVFAIGMTGKRDAWMRPALTWVLNQRNDDGGIPTVQAGDPSITDATAQAILAFTLLREPTTELQDILAVGEMAAWMAAHQHPSGGWAWRPGKELPWLGSTAYALLAIAGAKGLSQKGGSDLSDVLSTGLSFLQEARNDDCGWGSQPSKPSNAAVTGLCVYALSRLGLHERAQESAEYLLSEQRKTGGWKSSLDRPSGTSVIRFGDAYGLLGLARLQSFEDSGAVRRACERLYTSFKGSYFQYKDTDMRTWPTRDGILALHSVSTSLNEDNYERHSDGEALDGNRVNHGGL